MADSFDAMWDSIEVTPATSGADTTPADSFDAIWDSIPTSSKSPNLDYLVQRGAKGLAGAATLPMTITGAIQNLPPFTWAAEAGSKLASMLPGMPEERTTPPENLNTVYADKIQQAIMDNVTRNVGTVDEKDVAGPARYAGAALEAIPYAAYGGGVLPAITAGLGGQGGKDVAKTLGAGPTGEAIAEISGAIGGGSIPAAASSAARGVVKAITGDRTVKEASKALQNKAVGARLNDFIKSAKKDYLDPLLESTDEVSGTIRQSADASQIETKLTKNIDDVISSGIFKKEARDPKALFQANKSEMQKLGREASDIIKEADAALGNVRIYPKKFEFAENFIKSNRVPLEDKPRLSKMLAEAKQRYRSSIYDSYDDVGGLSVWQKEKQALQGVTYENDINREVLEKYIGADIRKFVEEVADKITEPGKLKAVNAKYAKHASVDPILQRSAIGTEVSTQGAKELMAQATTGGTRTGPTMRAGATGAALGTVAGAPFGASGLGAGVGALLGLGAGYGRGKMLEYVNSPGGQFALADLLSAISGPRANQVEMLGKIFGPGMVKSGAQSAAIGAGMGDNDKKVTQPTEPKEQPAPKRDVKAVEAVIDADPYYSALYEAESDRNPNARPINRKTGKLLSSAKGGFQLIDSTAKSLGVDDPFDLEQAFEGAKKLTEEHARKFKTNDPAELYSLHYLGETVYRKLKTGKALTEKEQEHVKYLEERALPRFMRIYNKRLQSEPELV